VFTRPTAPQGADAIYIVGFLQPAKRLGIQQQLAQSLHVRKMPVHVVGGKGENQSCILRGISRLKLDGFSHLGKADAVREHAARVHLGVRNRQIVRNHDIRPVLQYIFNDRFRILGRDRSVGDE
jgi:hypothetical protein